MTLVQLPVAPDTPTVSTDAMPGGRRPVRPVGDRLLRGLLRLLRPREGKVVFVVTGVPFCAFAVFMSLTRHMAFADALTRVNNAQGVITAFDPHLAAIGFVYGPLPSFFMVPFIPLVHVWPEFQVYNVVGGVMTALFAAGTMATVVGTARELRLPRLARYGLALGIGLHPIYLVYATNGMAEGINIFFLALTTRYLLRWLDPAQVSQDSDLLRAGIAVSAAYLTRIEPVASGIAITILIAAVVFIKTRGSAQVRRQEAAISAALVGLPFLFTFVVWAVTCKVIIGKWIPALAGALDAGVIDTLSMQAGQALNRPDANYANLGTRLEFLGKQTLGMAPLVVLAVIVMVLFVVVRSDWRGVAPLATFGASVFVDIAQLVRGNSFANLRYFMIVIPLMVYGLMMFATLPSGRLRPKPTRKDGRPRRLGRRYGVLVHLTSTVAVGLAITGPLAGVILLRDTTLAAQERPWWDSFLNGDKAALGGDVNTFIDQREAASYVDALATPPGTVLIDAAAASALLAGSTERDKFLSNADRTWERSVADPSLGRIQYFMVSDATGLAGDALDRAYPRLYLDGGGISDLVADFRSWRLYKFRTGSIAPRADGADRVPRGGFNEN